MKEKVYNLRLGIHKRPLHVSALALLVINAALFSFIFSHVGAGPSKADGQTFNVPTGIASDCSVDNSADIQSWLMSLPSGATAVFPTGACYLIQSQVLLQGTTGLTIDGNGAIFKRTDPTAIQNQNTLPLLYLLQNTNLAITGLVLDGSYNDKNYGGVGFEGHYGILMESNHGVSIDSITMRNIQGDFLCLQADSGNKTNGDHSLNTNITVTNSTFTNAGYHGLTFEAVNGFTFSHNTVTDVNVDAMDSEYDIYSTKIVNGQPSGAAEDNISIIDNTWNNCGYDWYVSIQGQIPGVQEQNIVLSGNTINNDEPVLEVRGTNQGNTTPDYYFNGLTFTNNVWLVPAKSTSGGSISKQYSGTPMRVGAVSNVTISGNTIPYWDGSPTYYPNHPFMAILHASDVNGLTLTNNNFNGALGVFDPGSSGNTIINQCGNLFAVGGSSLDFACAVPVCPTGQTGTPPNCVTPPVTNPNPVPVPVPPPSVVSNNPTTVPKSGAKSTQVYSASSPLGKSTKDPITANNVIVGLPAGVSAATVAKIVYSIDHHVVDTVSKAPFTMDYSTSGLTNGCHILTTTVYKTNQTVSSSNQQLCVLHKVSYYTTLSFKFVVAAIIVLLSLIVYGVILVKHRRLSWLVRFVSKKPPYPMVNVGVEPS